MQYTYATILQKELLGLFCSRFYLVSLSSPGFQGLFRLTGLNKD